MHIDAGDKGAAIANECKNRGYVLHSYSRGDEARDLKSGLLKTAHGRVVERTHSWMNRSRRVLIRWKKYVQNYDAMLNLSCCLTNYAKILPNVLG